MAKTPVYMPKFGMTMVEAEITQWYVEKGQAVSQGDPLLSIETEKTTVDIESPADGLVSALLFEQGDTAEVGNILTYIADSEAEIEEEALPEAPKVEALATPKEVPLAAEARPLPKLRKIIADNMRGSLQNSAQLTLFREVCIDALADYKAGRAGVSYNDLMLKAFALAGSRYEKARTQLVNDRLVVKEKADVGLAVALEDGLVVPALRDLAALSLAQIAQERKRVVDAARSGSLLPGDSGDCFGTITNLGGQQIDGFTPILNPPESIILGVGRILAKPWIKDGQIVPANVTTFSLTFDHQVLDGKDAADFLDVFVKILEAPQQLGA